MPAIVRGSTTRAVAEAAWALCSLITGALVARQLGPAGKGTVSSVSYLVALVALAAGFGLGEAGVIAVRGRGAEIRHVVRATVGFLAVSTTTGALLLLVLLRPLLGGDLDMTAGLTIAAACSVPAMTLWLVLAVLVEGEGGMRASSVFKVVSASVTLAATAGLVSALDLGEAGAVGAIGGGFAVGVVLCLTWLFSRSGVVPTPRLELSYLRWALPLGIPVQASYVLLGLTARVDLLVVQLMRDSAAAGIYSVALTMGQLVVYGPYALAVASYPVVAALPMASVPPFIERAGRLSLAAGTLVAVALAAVLPFGLPVVFGDDFRSAVVPTLLLLPAGALQGFQWAVCRLWSARGRGSLLASSSALSLMAMLVLDLLLVPDYGARGAAAASLAGSLAGAVSTWLGHHRLAGTPLSPTAFRPGLADYKRILLLPLELRGSGAA